MRSFITILTIFLTVSFYADARPKRVFQIPWGNINKCFNCHNNGQATQGLTSMGQQVYSSALIPQDSKGDVQWGVLAMLDADGDGYSNGEELQDAGGTWSSGEADPGMSELITDPNDPNDYPSGVEDEMEIVSEFQPNPAISSTMLQLNLKKAGKLSINIYDMNGNLIKTLVNGFLKSSVYKFSWNRKNIDNKRVASGSYIVTIQNDKYTILKKIILF